ncbi:MAG: ribosome rescue GTPase HflX [Succinivibrionaceae bacterium]
MQEYQQSQPRVILVHVELTSDASGTEDLAELRLLATSADFIIEDVMICRRSLPQPRFFIGSGKIEELKSLCAACSADLVIFNNHLSPAQERNISREINSKVIDRTALILEIFAQRARTYEGKLQVELAQLRYQSTRLVRGWTHLERQKGGFGLRGGPGEKQLELDRRSLRERIDAVMTELSRVESQRGTSRKARKKREIPVLSLVGYTNAGKSTLFNKLTSSDVYAADQLFATLDPTLRRLQLTDIGTVIFADTVGFIRHLPHDLVAAFRATLQETREASLLLHVVDCHDDRVQDNIEQVNEVLREIDAGDVPQLLVFNKIDLEEQVTEHVERDENGRPRAVWVSASTGEGLDLLLKIITELLRQNIVELTLQLPADSGKIRGELYRLQAITSESYGENGECFLGVRLPQNLWHQLDKKFGFQLSKYILKEK